MSFVEWLNEGVDFKDNFTPLYHLTSIWSLLKIISSDTLKPGNPVRGPKGICVTRSKLFEHNGEACRLILNLEELKKYGYKSYPLDEWALSVPLKKGVYPLKRKEWVNKSAISGYHLGKSNFSKIVQRPISHNIKGLSKSKVEGLEVEYEERILKEIKNLGKFIYGINIIDNSINKYEYDTDTIKTYLKNYPHIKIFKGKFFLKECELDDILK